MRVGDKVHYTISIWNAGPSDVAQAVTVRANLPHDARVVALQSDRGNCSVRKVTCSLGDLTAGDILKLHLTLQLKSPGANELRVTASSTTADPYAANNTVAITTSVYRKR